MAQFAVSTDSWDGKWEPFSSDLDEWLYFNLPKDEFDSQEVNDSSLKLTRHEIADRILHEIEDLGRNNTDDWLNEFPLFEEIQTVKSADEFENESGLKNGNGAPEFREEQISPDDVFVVPELLEQPLGNKDLFSVFNENAATFILSNENVLYIKNEPFVTLQRNCVAADKPAEEKIPQRELVGKTSENVHAQSELFWTDLDGADVGMEMAVVDEIIRNRALELDQWESDSNRSETSSNGTLASDLLPKEKEEEEEEEEESDDPDWKPESLQESGRRKCARRPKPCWRGGNQEEKKLRKKEQNKNAATRYRLKKKAEVNEILREEKSLKEKKAKLEEKVADIQSEIKCVKALMRDLFKAKGIIN